jgi:hypothetical protein
LAFIFCKCCTVLFFNFNFLYIFPLSFKFPSFVAFRL